MDEETPPRRGKLGRYHWAVLIVWGLLGGWLIISMITGVTQALYFGDGPIMDETPAPAALAAPPVESGSSAGAP